MTSQNDNTQSGSSDISNALETVIVIDTTFSQVPLKLLDVDKYVNYIIHRARMYLQEAKVCMASAHRKTVTFTEDEQEDGQLRRPKSRQTQQKKLKETPLKHSQINMALVEEFVQRILEEAKTLFKNQEQRDTLCDLHERKMSEKTNMEQAFIQAQPARWLEVKNSQGTSAPLKKPSQVTRRRWRLCCSFSMLFKGKVEPEN